MSEIKVNSIKGVGASAAAITVNNSDGTCTANITNNLSNRNLIINGAMQVAQRGTSSTSSGYSTIDRWVNSYSHDALMTFTQHALTSSDSGPYEEGFRYSNHVTNGDTTVNVGHYYVPQQPIESQNISMSGWNYKSSTGYITLSFWVKSSVGQTYQASLMTIDGTIYNYPFSFTVSANTWTKVIKKIPGNSNLQIDNDTGEGVRLNICPFMGTTYTSSSVNYDTWAAWGSGTRFKDFTSTWWTTNGATFEYTGVQLEVGSVATDFEHRSFGQELELCKRYCQVLQAGGNFTRFALGYAPGSSSVRWFNHLRPEMRSTPSFAHSGSFNCQPGGSFSISEVSLESASSSPQMAILLTDGNSGMSAGQAISLHANGDTTAKITFSSEL